MNYKILSVTLNISKWYITKKYYQNKVTNNEKGKRAITKKLIKEEEKREIRSSRTLLKRPFTRGRKWSSSIPVRKDILGIF